MDCNGNMIPDRCDVDNGGSNDCDGNGVPDECQPDCDGDLIPDDCEDDVNGNGTPDDCDPDCDNDGTPDFAEPDCDGDGTPDDCEPDCDNDGTPDDCEADCDSDGLPDDCEADCNANNIPDDCEGCGDSLTILWDADGCEGPFNSFSEFTPAVNGGCFNVSANPTNLYSPDGHSCTDDAIDGQSGGAFCINDQGNSDFTYNDPDGLYFTVTLTESNGVASQLETFSFYQVAPEYYFTSQQDGSSSSLTANDRPQQFGLRILRNGSEVFLATGLDTALSWSQETFDFSTNSAFTVVNESATFDFYLIAYGDDDSVSGDEIWDLDEFQVDVCCGNGGPASDCDGDGVPDFCEPDCDYDGIPDDCEADSNGNGIPDDCDCVPSTCPNEPGSWNLSGQVDLEFDHTGGSWDYYDIDCMTATYDGSNVTISGTATNDSWPYDTATLNMVWTNVSVDGNDLRAYTGSQGVGTMTTDYNGGETINIIGTSGDFGYAFGMECDGNGQSTLWGWWKDASNGDLVGDFYPTQGHATCEPCN